jgi:hypothetical protein
MLVLHAVNHANMDSIDEEQTKQLWKVLSLSPAERIKDKQARPDPYISFVPFTLSLFSLANAMLRCPAAARPGENSLAGSRIQTAGKQ